MNYFKTFLLLVLMGLLIILVGGLIGGKSGMIMAFGFALIFNFFSYWFSDKIVLMMYNAKPISASDSPVLYKTVSNLTARMDIPMPKLYIINLPVPNAFATGRNPSNAAVAVSPALIEALEKHELEAVIAHELTHIKNRDILVVTIAATIATAITFISRMAEFAAWFGMGRDRDDRGGNPIGLLVMAILAPIAALLIQFAISRTREYLADEGSARITNKPRSLATALEKISGYSKRYPIQDGSPSTASLFIINPMRESLMANIFSTHPTLGRRIKNLQKVAEELGQSF